MLRRCSVASLALFNSPDELVQVERNRRAGDGRETTVSSADGPPVIAAPHKEVRMKVGRELVDLAAEIQRQAEMKHDYIAPAARLAMSSVLASDTTRVPVMILNNGARNQLTIGDTAHEQIGWRLEIPRNYYDRMRKDAPDLLVHNVNHWLMVNPERKFMVRTLDGTMRALLSDSYRPLDNYDLVSTVLEKLSSVGCRIVSCELTERRLYLKAVTPKIATSIKVGDRVQAGLIITNSEIGLGAIKIEPLVYRLICENGAIINDMAMRRQHVGRKQQFIEMDGAEQYYRDETRKADDRAFWMKVRDVVDAMLNEVLFNKIVDRWKEATEQKITRDPVEVVEVTAKKFGLADSERSGVLTHLIQGGDLSAYGLMNAITRTAHDVESYDRSTDLERVGPAVLELPRHEWRELAEKS